MGGHHLVLADIQRRGPFHDQLHRCHLLPDRLCWWRPAGPTEETMLKRVLAANSSWCREGPRINLGHGLARTNESRAWPGVAILIRRGGQRPWDLRRIRVEGRAARWRPSGIRRRVEGWRGPCSWTLVGGACAKRMATVMQVLTAGMDEPGTTAWSSRSGGRRGLPSVDALPRPTVVPESGSAGDWCGSVDRHVVVRLWAFTVSGSPGTDEGPCGPRRGCGTSYGAARRSRGCAGGPAEAWP